MPGQLACTEKANGFPPSIALETTVISGGMSVQDRIADRLCILRWKTDQIIVRKGLSAKNHHQVRNFCRRNRLAIERFREIDAGGRRRGRIREYSLMSYSIPLYFGAWHPNGASICRLQRRLERSEDWVLHLRSRHDYLGSWLSSWALKAEVKFKSCRTHHSFQIPSRISVAHDFSFGPILDQ